MSDVYFSRGLLRERVQVAFRRLVLTRHPRFSDVLQRVGILKHLGYALATVGEFDSALLYIKEAARLAEQVGAVNDQRSLLQDSAYCLFRLDRWDEVLEILDHVRTVQNRYPRERAGPVCFPIAMAASVHAHRGDVRLGAAERSEAQAIMTSVAGSLDHWARAQFHWLSVPLLAEGEFALVKQYVEIALTKSPTPTGTPSGDHDFYAMLADAAMQQRDPAALRKYAPLAEATATRIDHKLYMAIAHRAWGVVHRLAGEDGEAERRLNLALKIFAEMGTHWQSGVTLFELGELARARGNTALARDYFSRALIAFEEMRAAPYAVRTRAALQQVGQGQEQADIQPPKQR